MLKTTFKSLIPLKPQNRNPFRTNYTNDMVQYLDATSSNTLQALVGPKTLRGGGGDQAYNFGNFDYEIRVEGEGQDTSRIF